MSKSWPFKDPNEVLNYGINWAPRMTVPGDTIADVLHTVVSGTVVKDSESFVSSGTTHTTTVVLSGGTDGESCEILCHITTTDGFELEQTVKIKIKPK